MGGSGTGRGLASRPKKKKGGQEGKIYITNNYSYLTVNPLEFISYFPFLCLAVDGQALGAKTALIAAPEVSADAAVDPTGADEYPATASPVDSPWPVLRPTAGGAQPGGPCGRDIRQLSILIISPFRVCPHSACVPIPRCACTFNCQRLYLFIQSNHAPTNTPGANDARNRGSLPDSDAAGAT